MSNKTRNIEAVRIHRPLATGQVRTDVEAAVCAIINVIFGVDLLPPCNPKALWSGTR
jgi:hypothetical protein